MSTSLPDVTEKYRQDGRPSPWTKRQARARAAKSFAASQHPDEIWYGYVIARHGRAGRQLTLVRIGRRHPRRLIKQGVVTSLHTRELVPGMKLIDPMGHRAVVLAGYPDIVQLQWAHQRDPLAYPGEPESTRWHAAV